MSFDQNLIQQLQQGDKKALARCITIVENELEGYKDILKSLTFKNKTPIVGITGPPGAGKSTLVNAIIKQLTQQNKTVGVIAVDPTSPFNFGSLLGDRLRMVEHFNNENVFIRSLATRGSLGGLSSAIIEVVDIMRSFGFDYIIIETVGVGQSEIEIAGLADTTLLVLVPEAGDEIQTIKSGIMEIADIFIVNKGDREGADLFMKNITQLVHSKPHAEWNIPVIKTVATNQTGINEVIESIEKHHRLNNNSRRAYLLTEKAFRLISTIRTKDISKQDLMAKISKELNNENFNIYQFIEQYTKTPIKN